MTTSSLLNRLLILATSAVCHADTFVSTSSFFTCLASTGGAGDGPAAGTTSSWDALLLAGVAIGWLSGTIASGLVSSSSSSPMLVSWSPPLLPSLGPVCMVVPAATMAVNSRLIVMNCSSDDTDRWLLAVSHEYAADPSRVGGVVVVVGDGGVRGWMSRYVVTTVTSSSSPAATSSAAVAGADSCSETSGSGCGGGACCS
ncbi:Os03g0808350, partial [Oryza sativa Japonica Group]